VFADSPESAQLVLEVLQTSAEKGISPLLFYKNLKLQEKHR
jgi:hypothetical protein